MDAEILKIFLEEAEVYLPVMRQGIIAYEQDASRIAELQESRRQAHTIKGSALMLKQSEIGEIAGEIESELKKVIQEKKHLNENQTNEFLSRILIFESHLKELRANLDGGKTSTGDSPVKAIEDLRIIETSDKQFEENSAQNETTDFEIDAEMLEVFALEAEDLLGNIRINLKILEKNPNNREALLEIRRSSHTLKGSAGIIGLKKISDLAHRVEDLLDFLAENEVAGDARIFEILQKAFDCLSAMADNENSLQLDQKVEQTYQNFDEILARLRTERDSTAESNSHSKQTENKAETDFEISIEEKEPAAMKAAENPPAEVPAPNRTAVRVSIERLNDLFNLVSEMVITRSVFEQRLSDLEQQISELHHTTRRLRASTDKLEIDFEINPSVVQSNFSHSKDIFQASAFGFDELEFDRYTDFNQTTRELIEATSDTSAINTGLDHLFDNLNLVFDNQRHLIEAMQNNLLRLRMVSLNSLAPRLQRTVSVTAEEEKKCTDFIIENDRLEIDAEILDAIVEPLLHLLRNAVAHGIEGAETRRQLGKPEKGRIVLRAFSEGTHLVFSVEDDGRGICASALKEKAVQSGFISKREADAMADEDAFSLVFLPGLSTAQQINQVSGRGVGMNIVKTSVSRRSGTVSVKSEAGRGTTFTVRVPVSMAVTRALLVRAGTQIYAFPLNLVKQATEISKEAFEKAVAEKTLIADGDSYSIFHFNDLLGLPQFSSERASAIQVLMLKSLETPCALAVNEIIKTEEIVIKPLGILFKDVSQFIGATILGDGTVVPVLDLVYLLKNQNKTAVQNSVNRNKSKAQTPKSRILNVLIVDDSPSVRMINSNLIKKTGWNAATARDGLDALEILQSAGELPDVILTDVEMPRMDGYEFLASLKKQPNLAQIPVVMITSRAGDKHRRKAFDLGADEYLSKPYEDTFLLEKIKALIKSE